MRATASLIRREFNAYFLSPIAYVVLAVFLAVTGHLFYLTLEMLTASGPKGISYPMELIVNSVPLWLVFVAISPLLTMRLFAVIHISRVPLLCSSANRRIVRR